MAGKRIEIMDLRQLLRLKKEGKSNREVAKMLSISRNTINSYIKRILAYELNYEELQSLEDNELYDLFPSESEIDNYRYKELSQYFPSFVNELKRPGCTKQVLWEGYISKHPDGYMSSQFCHHLNAWLNITKVSGKLEHTYGEKLYIDFTGKKLPVIDRSTGEIEHMEVFVGILPASQLTFVKACRNQSKEEVVSVLNDALHYFGGVPKAIVSDNLKSVVTKSHKYAPTINPTLRDFAMHYGCVIDPTRPYSPQDKALVEGAVKLVYQRIFYPLSKHSFFHLDDLAKEINVLLETYNNYRFSQSDSTRRKDFMAYEKEFLSPLSSPYPLREFRHITVHKMGYVYLAEDKHYYSVPYRLIGNKVMLCYGHSTIEVYYKKQRVAFHKRDFRKGKYSTNADHLSSSHKAYSSWSLEYFQDKAMKIGDRTCAYITQLIQERDYPETGYKQALGIIHLSNKHSKQRINKACETAQGLGKHNYHIIKNILDKGTNKLGSSDNKISIPKHENIRGTKNYN